MTTRASIVVAVLTVTGGAVAGLLSASWLAGTKASQASAEKAGSEHADPPRVVERVEVRTIRHARPSSDEELQGDEQEENVVNELSVGPPDPVEALETLKADFRRDLEHHEQDPRDPRWAPRSETSLRAGLESTEGSHTVLGIDCKTTSCVARIQWPSHSEAAREYANLLAANLEPNCATKILVHEGIEAPFEENLILDCTEARATEE